jgi:hypothetical protein
MGREIGVCVYCAFVGPYNKLYNVHGTYITMDPSLWTADKQMVNGMTSSKFSLEEEV